MVEAFREAAARKRRGLVLLGDPGSGKTTHLRRLVLWCARKGAGELGLSPDTLPVFLPLRELGHDEGASTEAGLVDFVRAEVASAAPALPEDFADRLLERGRLLLLFDGLDEVPDRDARARVTRAIERLHRRFPDAISVVTCRFAGYGAEARLGARFLELHLRPLTREQAAEFVRNWYRIVETGLAPTPAAGEAEARRRSDELLSRLAEPEFRSARLVEMTRNPLLLANLCLVHRDRGKLPRGRARLYDECVDVLLERWRENKALGVSVTAEVGRRVLQPAALFLHAEEERTRAGVAELAPVIEPALAAAKWQGGGAADFLQKVRDESGLLTGWAEDQYGFMHLGFQEYLAIHRIDHAPDAYGKLASGAPASAAPARGARRSSSGGVGFGPLRFGAAFSRSGSRSGAPPRSSLRARIKASTMPRAACAAASVDSTARACWRPVRSPSGTATNPMIAKARTRISSARRPRCETTAVS